MRRVGKVEVSKSIDVHLPSPVGSLVVRLVAGSVDVAIEPKHAIAVPPCWEGCWGSWMLWDVDESKGMDGLYCNLEERLMEGGRVVQLVLVSARRMMSICYVRWIVIRSVDLSVVADAPRPLMLLHQMRHVGGFWVLYRHQKGGGL